jgi:hypothetical protein
MFALFAVFNVVVVFDLFNVMRCVFNVLGIATILGAINRAPTVIHNVPVTALWITCST